MSLTLTPATEHPAVSRARLHRNLSNLVERLIAMLDDLAGDPDLENDADDEPSLSFTGDFNQDRAIRLEPIGGVQFIDLENVDEDEDDDPGGGNVTDEPHDGEEGE